MTDGSSSNGSAICLYAPFCILPPAIYLSGMRTLLLLFLISTGLTAQHQHDHKHDRAIHFPDTKNYQTLIVDLHTHSVFSDGSVWPDIRVEEAVRDGLDALAFTEHLEYQPHQADIPHPDRNRATELGTALAKPHDLMIIPGAEITRDLPPGHSNALFIQDANKLNVKDAYAAFAEAKRQNAFVFWNHPNWVAQQKNGVATLSPMHQKLIDQDMLHGIEVVNDLTISKEALAIALEHDLTIIGTSDVHGLVDWQYHIHEGGHRPVTLVLAEARTQDAVEAALRAGRTVAYFEQTLVGREDNLLSLMETTLTAHDAAYRGPSSVLDVNLANDGDCELLLENISGYSLQSDLGIIRVPPHSEVAISVMTLEQQAETTLRFKVLNAVTSPDDRLEVSLTVRTE